MEKQRARKAFLSARCLFETTKRRGPAGCFLVHRRLPSHLLHQSFESRIFSQTVEDGLGIQFDEIGIAFGVRSLKPCKCFLGVATRRVDFRDVVRQNIALRL